MFNPLFKKLEGNAKELVNSIRKFSKSQKDSWQKVPFLALQADGRTGFSDQYSRAYRLGYWAVEITIRDGSYSVFVDLETGELVSTFDPRKKAKDEDVLMTASDLSQINAESIVKELQEEGKRPVGSYYNAEEQERWRRDTLKELGLKPNQYKRKVSPKEVHEKNMIAGLVDQ